MAGADLSIVPTQAECTAWGTPVQIAGTKPPTGRTFVTGLAGVGKTTTLRKLSSEGAVIHTLELSAFLKTFPDVELATPADMFYMTAWHMMQVMMAPPDCIFDRSPLDSKVYSLVGELKEGADATTVLQKVDLLGRIAAGFPFKFLIFVVNPDTAWKLADIARSAGRPEMAVEYIMNQNLVFSELGRALRRHGVCVELITLFPEFTFEHTDYIRMFTHLMAYERAVIVSSVPANFSTDAGVDLTLAEDVDLAPGENYKAKIRERVTPGLNQVGLVHPRSSTGFMVTVFPGVIDPFYIGELSLGLHNISQKHLKFETGRRLAQVVLLRCDRATAEVAAKMSFANPPTMTIGRGGLGFGSTGAK